MSEGPSSDEAYASLVRQGLAYERGLFLGEAKGEVSLTVDYSLNSMKARREFLLTGRLNLIVYGALPAGIGISVGDPDIDPGPADPVDCGSPTPPENEEPTAG